MADQPLVKAKGSHDLPVFPLPVFLYRPSSRMDPATKIFISRLGTIVAIDRIPSRRGQLLFKTCLGLFAPPLPSGHVGTYYKGAE